MGRVYIAEYMGGNYYHL